MINHINTTVVNQQISYSISTFILHGKSLHPFAEVIGDHQNITESLQRRVTDVQIVHGDTIPAMTGGNIAQRMMAAHR